MAIFSRLKSAKEKKDAKTAISEEPKAPVKREPYVPRYAVRDALQCAPTTWKQDSYDAFRKAHQERFAREQEEMGSSGRSNPKLSPRLGMSRNSSSLSVAMMDASRPSSSRRHSAHAAPSTSGGSSYVSVSGLGPGEVPVPSIPAQFASRNSTPGPSTPRSLSRSSSSQQLPSLEAHLQSSPLARPNPPFRQSYTHTNQGVAKKAMGHDFGSTPMESPDETPVESRSTSPTDNVNLSSTASTYSESSGEAIEMAPAQTAPHDTPCASPVLAQNQERVYPSDPRKLGKAPVITIEESTPPPRKYFTHTVKPVEAAPTSPQAPPQKKPRFSLIRRNQAVPAH